MDKKKQNTENVKKIWSIQIWYMWSIVFQNAIYPGGVIL